MRNPPCFRLGAVLASASLLLCMVSASALAQRQTGSGISGRSLPEAPLPTSGPLGSARPVLSAEGSASVAAPGTVGPLAMESAENGEFEFMSILPGSCCAIVNAEGFTPSTSAAFVVTERQA